MRFIDVNETGTEATAAASITTRGAARSMRYEPLPIIFRADLPSLFLICYTRSGSVLSRAGSLIPQSDDGEGIEPSLD